MGNPTATIDVELDTKKTKAGLKSLTKDFKKSATNINASLEIIAKAAAAVTGALGAVAGQIKEMIELANVQEKAERQALSAIRLRTKFTDQAFGSLKRFNSALQQKIGVGDEELLQLQKMLATMGVQSDRLEEATRQTIGLSEATGTGLAGAARLVGRALNGEVSALKRYGITAADATDASRQLSAMFSVAEDTSGLFGTKVNVLTANFGDLKEEIGKLFTENEDFVKLIDDIGKFVLNLGTAVSQNKSEIMAFFNDLLDTMEGIADAATVFALANPLTGVPAALIANAPGAVGGAAKKALDEAADQAFLNRQLGAAGQDVAGLGAIGASDVRDVGGGGGLGGFGGPKSKLGSGKKRRTRKKPRGDQFGAPEDRGGAGLFADFGMFDPTGGGLATLRGSIEAELEMRRLRTEEIRIDNANALEADRNRVAVGNEIQIEWLSRIRSFTGAVKEAAAEVASGVGGLLASAITSVVTGTQSVLQALGGFIGGIIVQMGTLLIQLGTVGVLAGTLGTVIPALKLLTGGELGIAAGAAAIAAGGVMVGVGAAMGGGGGGPGSSAPVTATTTGRSAATGAKAPAPQVPNTLDQLAGLGGGAAQPLVVNVNFQGPVGSPRRAARAVRDLLLDGQSLLVGAG